MFYTDAFKYSFDFKGVAERKNYWLFFLVNTIISFTLDSISNDIYSVYVLIVIIPSIAYGVRRLHDAGKSGWWLLCPIVNIIFLCFPQKDSVYNTPKVFNNGCVSQVK